jgi:hypothetical protein
VDAEVLSQALKLSPTRVEAGANPVRIEPGEVELETAVDDAAELVLLLPVVFLIMRAATSGLPQTPCGADAPLRLAEEPPDAFLEAH